MTNKTTDEAFENAEVPEVADEDVKSEAKRDSSVAVFRAETDYTHPSVRDLAASL